MAKLYTVLLFVAAAGMAACIGYYWWWRFAHPDVTSIRAFYTLWKLHVLAAVLYLGVLACDRLTKR